MKCHLCDNEAKFSVTHLEKNETMYFCAIHFLVFCKEMSSNAGEILGRISSILKDGD